MHKESGVSITGNQWTVILDQTGFHFSIGRKTDIIAELVPTNRMPKDDFYAKIAELDDELMRQHPQLEAITLETPLCETEDIDGHNDNDG